MSIELNIKYRIYPDGEVIHQDDFEDKDNSLPYYDDYQEIEVPQLILEYIEDTALGK